MEKYRLLGKVLKIWIKTNKVPFESEHFDRYERGTDLLNFSLLQLVNSHPDIRKCGFR